MQIDGTVAVLGNRVGPDARITIDGVPVLRDVHTVHYLLHKPTGVVTTADDPQGRPTVVELVPTEPRVFPVGRLDLDTSGLLLLTNDGELANLLTHPRHGVDKAYLAEVEGRPSPGTLRALRTGIELDDGPTAPAKARVVQTEGPRSLVELVIHEGRNRQVRRMLDAVGHPVVRLVRTRIGPLHDDHLAPGQWRVLDRSEVRALHAAALTERGPEPTTG